MRPKKEMEINMLELKKQMKKTKIKSEFQRLQCIWLRELCPDFTASKIGEITVLSESSVWRIHSEIMKNKDITMLVDNRGGRYNENMNKEEEDIFLKPYFKKANESGIIIANEIKIDYENKIGHSVPKSTIYRMLNRNGWRKIVPYKRNPKANPEKQDEFKKNSRK